MTKLSKIFIEVYECKRPHYIFTGKNALMQALFFDKMARLATPDELFGVKFNLDSCCSWGMQDGNKSKNLVKGLEVVGCGVHAKLYTTKGSLILSSQNNGQSPLFEFAILYPENGKSKLRTFIERSIYRAHEYSKWWSTNKLFGIRG